MTDKEILSIVAHIQYEMFAPNLMRLLVETNQNVKTVMLQNSELQQKCKQLEQEIAELKSNS